MSYNLSGTFDRAHTLAAVADIGKAADYTSEATLEYNRLKESGEKATVLLAVAAYTAVKSGYIGKEKVEGHLTFEEWGKQFPYRDRSTGKDAFYKRARISQLALAGEAIVRHGVDPDSETGQKLLNGVSVREAIQKDYRKNVDASKQIEKAVKAAVKKSAGNRASSTTGDTWPRKKPTTDEARLEALDIILAGWETTGQEKFKERLLDIATNLRHVANTGKARPVKAVKETA